MKLDRSTLLPVVAVGALFVGACGGSDDAAVVDSASGDSAPAVTEATPVTEAPAATEAPRATEAPTATEAPAPTEAPAQTDPPPATEAPEPRASIGGDFCDIAESFDTNELFVSLTPDPAEVEAAMNELRAALDELREAAPDQIADDVGIFADLTNQVVDAIAAADYDLLDTDLGFVDEVAYADELDAASERINDYARDECGLDLDDGDDTAAPTSDPAGAGEGDGEVDFDIASGTIREQIADQLVGLGFSEEEATCLADSLDASNEDVLAGDADEVLALFEQCDISFSRLAELGG